MHLVRQQGKIINYLFGLINVTLFAVIFFQIQLYASLLLQLFFSAPTFTVGMPEPPNRDNQAELQIRWLPLPKALAGGGLRHRHWPDDL